MKDKLCPKCHQKNGVHKLSCSTLKITMIMINYKTIHENKVLINPPDELEGLKKKIQKLLDQGRNNEKLNERYRELILNKLNYEK